MDTLTPCTNFPSKCPANYFYCQRQWHVIADARLFADFSVKHLIGEFTCMLAFFFCGFLRSLVFLQSVQFAILKWLHYFSFCSNLRFVVAALHITYFSFLICCHLLTLGKLLDRAFINFMTLFDGYAGCCQNSKYNGALVTICTYTINTLACECIKISEVI